MTQLEWVPKHPRATPEMLGYIPSFLSSDNPAGAAEQIHNCYRHSGGWSPFQGFRMLPDGNMQYPGDPPTRLLFEARLRQEIIRFYEHSWVAIVQPSGEFEVSRVD